MRGWAARLAAAARPDRGRPRRGGRAAAACHGRLVRGRLHLIGYAEKHPRQTAGIVTFDTFAPDPNPPPEVVRETDPDNPENVEHRDYLKVENQAWDAKKRIGDIPVEIVAVRYPKSSESPAERRNAKDQRGWLVLSPRAELRLVSPPHEIVEDKPELAEKVVLGVVDAAG